MRSVLCRHCHSLVLCRAAVSLLALVALAWGSLAFCAEIHEAARDGDLGRVKELLKDSPSLASSQDANGHTPLHYAALNGRKDVAELLLANQAEVNAKDGNYYTPLGG
jgi:ankyrin repeat protein